MGGFKKNSRERFASLGAENASRFGVVFELTNKL